MPLVINPSWSVSVVTARLKPAPAVKDAVFYNFIKFGADGTYFYQGGRVGKTTEDMLHYFKNPINEEQLVKLLNDVEYYWNM